MTTYCDSDLICIKIKQQLESKKKYECLVYQTRTYLETIKRRLDKEQMLIDPIVILLKEDYDVKHNDLQQFIAQYAAKLTQDSTEQSQQYEEWTPKMDDVD